MGDGYHVYVVYRGGYFVGLGWGFVVFRWVGTIVGVGGVEVSCLVQAAHWSFED